METTETTTTITDTQREASRRRRPESQMRHIWRRATTRAAMATISRWFTTRTAYWRLCAKRTHRRRPNRPKRPNRWLPSPMWLRCRPVRCARTRSRQWKSWKRSKRSSTWSKWRHRRPSSKWRVNRFRRCCLSLRPNLPQSLPKSSRTTSSASSISWTTPFTTAQPALARQQQPLPHRRRQHPQCRRRQSPALANNNNIYKQ